MEYKKRPIHYPKRSPDSKPIVLVPIIANTSSTRGATSWKPSWKAWRIIQARLPANLRQRLRQLSKRQAALLSAGIVLFSLAVPILTVVVQRAVASNTAKRYQLSAISSNLLGDVNKKLTPKLTHDESKKLYQYNKQSDAAAGPAAALEASQKVGGGQDDYSVDLSEDSTKGVTIHDTANKLSISLTPQFKTLDGKQLDGRIIYPLDATDAQLVYSVKTNGLKEDLVLPKAQGDSLNFSYKLDLPATLDAKLLPNGDIGIYSADLTLFGNISYGSDADQKKVEAARTKSDKTHLAFVLPAPVVKEAGNRKQGARNRKQEAGSGEQKSKAMFELKDSILTVKATNLAKASYPLSIDPSIVVTSASDFARGNDEGGIAFDTANNQIKRGALTGGTVGAWSTNPTSLPNSIYYTVNVAYNGFLYTIGGANGGYTNTVYYAPINANGTIGSWVATTSFATARDGHVAAAYNGYMYIVGGFDGGTTLTNTQYAKINLDGTIGAWVSNTTSFTNARFGHAGVVYNGNLYITGGCAGVNILSQCSGIYGDTQYAPIQGNGSLGTWVTSTNTFTGARFSHGTVAYNGYIYILAGSPASSAFVSDVQYAPINSDGSLGTWVTAPSLPTARQMANPLINNGYLYVIGGYNGSGGFLTDTQYAQINANGSLGAWNTTSNIITGRSLDSAVTYNGYVYVLGGCNGASCSSTITSIEYAKIDPAGVTGNWATNSTTFTNTRDNHASVAYNGYLYVLGGCVNYTLGLCNALNDVQYAPINPNGTIGTWAATTSLPAVRYNLTSLAYNGYLYFIGGYAGGASQNDVQYATINANGTIGAWATTTTFTTGRQKHTTEINNGYMYVIGGTNGTTLADVQYALINANGTTGTWTATTSLATARSSHSSAIAGGYMYVLGGNPANELNDVQYAPINANGTIGTWAATTSFTTVRSGHASVATKGYLYIIGGSSGGGKLNDTQYAQINSNGTIGTWTATTSFTTPRLNHVAVSYQGIVYLTGGSDSGGPFNDTQYAPINNGGKGTTTSWSTNVTSYTTGRYLHASVAYNGYLYVIAGVTPAPATALDDVQYAPITAAGKVGTWAATTSFPTGNNRYGHSARVSNGYLYVIGGLSNVMKNDVMYAPINSNGTIGSWTISANTFTTARYNHTTAIHNGFLYVLGGCSTRDGLGACVAYLNDVQYAKLGANGDITTNGVSSCNSGGAATWCTMTAGFTTGRFVHTTVVANGYIYILGGCTAENISGCVAYLNDVQYAPLNSNGSLGSWLGTTSFSIARTHHSSVVNNGYIYIIGGYNGPVVADVQYAPINANGTIGTWTATTSLPSGRYLAGTATYNGYIYTTGGCTSSCGLADTIISGQEAIPRIGKYSYASDYGGDANLTKLLYRGTITGGSALGISFTSAPSSTGVFGALTNAIDPGSNNFYTFPKTEAKTYQFNYTLDDSSSAVFPDTAGTPTAIADIEVFFHAATTKRLRGGKTFTNETQRSLDAQP